MYGGAEHPVGPPEVIDQTAAFLLLPKHWRLICQVFGIKQYVRLTNRSVVEAEALSSTSSDS